MPSPPASPPLELWGGVECTVNRVGDRFFDQMERSGHAAREDDLERLAALGLKALRYPMLWERLAPDRAEVADWSWPDRRLGRLRELGIRPIVGLVHHGSGPRRTNLLDPGFAGGLADFARQVAGRYPWLEDYTPVNEPLTTARFSALYGLWYPHARDDRSFVRAFLNQCRAVVLAMRAVRAVNPAARLVQTEDLGRTHSTPALADQAAFENERRWLTFDLLAGRIGAGHPMRGFLQGAGASAEELDWFQQHACPPDLLGINHYVTSERFLDERLDRYPAYARAGDGARAYADLPAARVAARGVSGPGRLLREAWARYGLPLAVTEVQLNCTREEQMRWFAEVWQDARALRGREGADVRAVTLWALLGAFNWTNLLTREDPAGYEPGAFDLRAPQPRLTALGALACRLGRGGAADHPVLAVPGWWRRPERFVGPPADACQPLAPPVRPADGPGTPAPLLIAGPGGALAHALEAICRERAVPCRRLDAPADDALRRALDKLLPWAVIQAADEPARPADAAARETLARVCAERGLPLAVFSGGAAFGDRTDGPFDEDVPPTAGEAGVLAASPGALLLRTGVRFSPWHDLAPAAPALAAVPSRPPPDETFTLAYLPDVAHACLDLLLDGERGVWHLANAGTLGWHEFAACAAEISGQPAPMSAAGAAPRANRAVVSRRANLLPPWQSALRHLLHTRRDAGAAVPAA